MEFTGLRGAQAAVLFLGNEADRHCWTNGHADTILARDMSSVGTSLEASLVVDPPPFSLVSLLPATWPMGQRRCLLILVRNLVQRG